MRRYLLLLLCLIIFVACEPAGTQVLTKLISHYDAMIGIIKENKADPDLAKQKLADYKNEHADEYARLIQELEVVTNENMENPHFAEILHEFTRKNYELVKEAAKIGIDGSF